MNSQELIDFEKIGKKPLSQSKAAIKGRLDRKKEGYKKWKAIYEKTEKYKTRIKEYQRKLRAHPTVKQYHKEYQRRYREKHRIRYLARHAIIRAKNNGLPCDTEFMKIIGETHPSNCPCCGIILNYKYTADSNGPLIDGPSLDRINTLGGYTEGNVEIICWRCNAIKRDATLSELEKIVSYMRAKLL